MSKSQQTYNKKEREKKRKKKRQEKEERKAQRKLEKAERGKTKQEDQFMYMDINGNFTTEKPDPNDKIEIKAEDIELGVPQYARESIETVINGKVKFFSEDKGYGFITIKSNKESIFVHINDAYEGIKENHIVQFEIGKGPKGAKAIKVVQVK